MCPFASDYLIGLDPFGLGAALTAPPLTFSTSYGGTAVGTADPLEANCGVTELFVFEFFLVVGFSLMVILAS